jgi:hypothetical protein
LAALLLNSPQSWEEEAGAQAEQMALIVTETLAQGLLAR